MIAGLFGRFVVQNISCFIFLCHCFVFRDSFGNPLLFHTYFHTHCDVSRTRNILQNYSNFSQISFAKSVNKRFVNITFCCSLFFSEAV